MSDLTICKFGCSSIDGCKGHCEEPRPAMSNPQAELIKQARHWIAKFEALPVMTPDAQKMRQCYLDLIAEIKRQGQHLERLASTKMLCDESEYLRVWNERANDELKARIAYARNNRWEDEK